ncbi:MAG: ornithine carbamoyltransferase, partial [Cyanobacteria bacterium P01_E01_bin.48]
SGRSLLTLADLSPFELQDLLALAADLKCGATRVDLSGRVLGLLFRKASTRTRVSFSAAIAQCGGTVIDLMPDTMQVSRGESVADTARILSGYLDALAIRTFDQAELDEFSSYARIPVLNALTDLYHPCQILADLLTVIEIFGQLHDVTVTYCGDGNNVAHSLILGCALAGAHIRVASPVKYAPDPTVLERARAIVEAGNTGSQIALYTDPSEAAAGAQVLYTDVWASMGQENSAESRTPLFEPFQINARLLDRADPDAIVLHCLPAHRGEEITADVLEGPRSRVWQQAENRLHAQKALLASILSD